MKQFISNKTKRKKNDVTEIKIPIFIWKTTNIPITEQIESELGGCKRKKKKWLNLCMQFPIQ